VTTPRGVRVRCGACDGTGARPLTPVQAETLAAVGEEPSLLADIMLRIPKRYRPSGTALANRLVALEEIGLVVRERQPGPVLGRGHGKAMIWRRRRNSAANIAAPEDEVTC
jgi:hypothetical protein